MTARTRTVYQAQIAECGAAALGIILDYFGCHVPLEQLRIDTGVTRDGCNACHILEGASLYGLNGRGRRLGAAQLAHVQMPCILHWQNNHFVVLEGFSGRYAVINDPARGRRRIPMDRFAREYSGIALLFEKTERFHKQRGRNMLAGAFTGAVSGRLGSVLILGAAHLLMITALLVFLLTFRIGIDQLLSDMGTVSGDVLLAAALSLASMVLSAVFCCILPGKLRIEADVLSSRDLVRRFLQLPDIFFEQRYLGDLSQRTDNVLEVDAFIFRELILVPGMLLLFAGSLAAAFALSTTLALIATLFLLLFAAVMIPVLQRGGDLAEQWSVEGGQLAGASVNAFSVTGTIKSAGLEQETTMELMAGEERCGVLYDRMRRRKGIARMVCAGILTALLVCVCAAGHVLLQDHQITPGTLMVFPAFCALLLVSAGQIPAFLAALRQARASISRVEDVERFPEGQNGTEEKTASETHGKLSGEITAEGISGGYSQLAGPVISGVSLKAGSGQRIAVVGGSGSGKSTLLKILSGAMTPWEGELLFDGKKIEEIPASVLYASVAAVRQDVVLFGGTVRDNLTLWNQNILEEDILRAARDAQIHDVILKKDRGYDHLLSENGRNFSGGQRACLEIARALSLNPSVLILDEATGHMDAGTEKLVLDAIKRRGCTCIMTSHRLETVRDCDEILVLRDGKVAERGRHEELMALHGIYHKMVGDPPEAHHA